MWIGRIAFPISRPFYLQLGTHKNSVCRVLVVSFWQAAWRDSAIVRYIYFACSAAGNSSCFLFLASVDVVRYEESSCGYQEEIRWTPAHPSTIIHVHGGPTTCSMLGKWGCRSLAKAYGEFYVQSERRHGKDIRGKTHRADKEF